MSDPVDLANLREMTDGDVELEQELFAEFYSSSEECIATMDANCVDGDNEPYRGNAHAMKGTAVNLGAARLGELCEQAQSQHSAPATDKQALMAEIRTEYEKVKAFLITA